MNLHVPLFELAAEIKAAFSSKTLVISLPKRKKNDSCSKVSQELPWAF